MIAEQLISQNLSNFRRNTYKKQTQLMPLLEMQH